MRVRMTDDNILLFSTWNLTRCFLGEVVAWDGDGDQGRFPFNHKMARWASYSEQDLEE